MAKGTKDPDLDRVLPPNTPVSWRMSRSSSGVMPEMSRAPDCEQRDCFVVQGKKQETNTGAKA